MVTYNYLMVVYSLSLRSRELEELLFTEDLELAIGCESAVCIYLAGEGEGVHASHASL